MKPSFADFLARVSEARQCGFAVDRGTMFQGITQVSVPVLSPPSRAMQSAAARLSESVRLLRLG